MIDEGWNQKKLEALILNGVEESAYLEFKSADGIKADKKDICKDVSAFANSDGGVLIYGISEKDSKAHSISFIDGSTTTAEQLEQIINDGIHRRIQNVKIYPIRFEGDIKKSVYVVEIPTSDFSPHMTFDKKFYKRGNKISLPMEEYEIRQSYHKKKNIKLKVGNVQITSFLLPGPPNTNRTMFRAIISVENVGKIIAKEYRMKLYWSDSIIIHDYDRKQYEHLSDILGDSLSTINPPIIFPSEEMSILQLDFKPSPKYIKGTIPFQFFIYTEDSTTIETKQIAVNLDLQSKDSDDSWS
jgi:hypothetical protein